MRFIPYTRSIVRNVSFFKEKCLSLLSRLTPNLTNWAFTDHNFMIDWNTLLKIQNWKTLFLVTTKKLLVSVFCLRSKLFWFNRLGMSLSASKVLVTFLFLSGTWWSFLSNCKCQIGQNLEISFCTIEDLWAACYFGATTFVKKNLPNL